MRWHVARKASTPKGPTPVETITHGDKRANIPTADAHDFVDPQIEAVQQVRYPRDPSLDPQLVWRGKDEQDSTDLVTDAPPIYIQEKIHPRVLVENLRKTAQAGELEPELTLFDTFDGLNELDLVDFYQHQANWSNRMILGDSQQVMASLAERELLRGKVQMIYMDPPYGIKFGSNWQVSTRKRDVKDGKLEDAAREAEQIKAFRDTWELGIHSYLSYLRDRLVVGRDLLTQSGSVFVQIGDENVHLVRSLLDEVFGSENFVSQITFLKTSSSTGQFGGTSDLVLWFAKEKQIHKFRPLFLRKTTGGAGGTGYTRVQSLDGTQRPLSREEVLDNSLLPVGARIFAGDNLTSQSMGREKGEGASSWFQVSINGRKYDPGSKARWKTNESGMARLLVAGRVMATSGRNLAYLRYLDDFPALPLENVWTDTLGQNQFGGDKTYVVQTALPVVERCMLMCTDPGDLVLDPTCGSGTTAYVAEQWGRRWITIDTSRVALALARQRLMGAKFPYYLMADSVDGRSKEQEVTAKAMPPTEVSGDIRRGFVYERVQHITLKSIANNPDIKEGMTRHQIDEAIKRHADFEMLYDKPFEDKKTVRVTGPFTVESLSPHRSLAFAGSVDDANRETISEQDAAEDAESPNFEQSIIDNLAKAGIQNGRRAERITFSSLDSYAGVHVQAIGERRSDDEDAAPTRVGIAIGPQYGTVSPGFIKDAAREAIRASNIDLLCILGFAFDPQATGVTADDGVTVEAHDEGFANVAGERKMGRIKVLLVRMNADLLMGEDLKKTGAGNLFTVFGEPDIELRDTADGQVVVDLRGVDVYDPTTGEVRSNDTSQIALWMIDTNYNEESFFVRHCYFTGGNDPYSRLKRALKADIDAEAWDSLNRTESRPFDKPETGKIAVKVINDYGDEVMKIFNV
jgi:adenine-specific DNA-methyltransferase